MHYVVDLVEGSFPDLLKFPEEMSHVADGHKGVPSWDGGDGDVTSHALTRSALTHTHTRAHHPSWTHDASVASWSEAGAGVPPIRAECAKERAGPTEKRRHQWRGRVCAHDDGTSIVAVRVPHLKNVWSGHRPGRAGGARPGGCLPGPWGRGQKFYETASQTLQELERKFEAMDKAFAEAVTLFGEDPKSTTPEDFFSIFYRFTEAWTVPSAVARCAGGSW